MINGFRLRRGLRTHPDGFASKFWFIRVIRVIRGFNFGSRVKLKHPTPLSRERAPLSRERAPLSRERASNILHPVE
jgi:hypothetical protein